MPVVHVELYEGRTADQKRAIASGITKAISQAAGLPDSATIVIFRDVKKSDWSNGGVLASEQK